MTATSNRDRGIDPAHQGSVQEGSGPAPEWLNPRFTFPAVDPFGMFEKVFVAFDGSPESRRACQVAIEIAARFHSSVTVGTVHPATKEPTDGHLESLVPFDAEGKSLAVLIEELRAAALALGVTSLEPVFIQGDVVPALITFLNGNPHDLAVTGSRGLTRGQRLLLGSVSAGLVGEAPCPVLVVRTPKGRRVPREVPPGPGPVRPV
jgi:nucleotide-binding universal stress UspA family protein